MRNTVILQYYYCTYVLVSSTMGHRLGGQEISPFHGNTYVRNTTQTSILITIRISNFTILRRIRIYLETSEISVAAAQTVRETRVSGLLY